MTLGERIAALRKEKGLSQEALGELVGVTRQAVSKWEADRAVPDVNNCVTMSRVFGVPLAVLLELEEEAPAAVELTETHIRLLEQMTEKYAAAQRRARSRWRWPILLAACAALVGAAWLWEWLNDMNRTIDYLSGEIAGLQGEIISGVGDRVKESLEAENSLVTDYRAEIVAADVIENTVTFSISVNLKEGQEATRVSFSVSTGDSVVMVPAAYQGGLRYQAEITCLIQDEPAVDLIVEESGTSRSQALIMNSYESDYAMRLSGGIRWAALTQSGLTADAMEPVEVFAFLCEGPGLPAPLTLTRLEVVLLQNDEVIETVPVDWGAGKKSTGEWSLHEELDIPVDEAKAVEGDTLTFALLAQDNYGRKASAILSRYRVLEDGQLDYLAHEILELDDGTYGTEVWR